MYISVTQRLLSTTMAVIIYHIMRYNDWSILTIDDGWLRPAGAGKYCDVRSQT